MRNPDQKLFKLVKKVVNLCDKKYAEFYEKIKKSKKVSKFRVFWSPKSAPKVTRF